MLQALNQSATSAQRQKLLEVAGTLPPSIAKAIYRSAMDSRGMMSDTKPLEIVDKITSPSVREETLKMTLDNSWSLSSEEMRELFSRLQPTSQTTGQAAQSRPANGWTDPAGAINGRKVWVQPISARAP